MSSSLTTPASRIPLAQVLAGVPDRRDPRGVRHALPVVLTVAAAAVIAGARSLLAIGEWVADVDREPLETLGIDRSVVLPSESTIRRALAGIDADDLDRRLAAWMATRTGQAGGRRVIAVDGKSLRGAACQGVMPHLLAAIDHDHGVVLGQRRVPDKASEITELPHLLAGMNLSGAVVTADALHCQRATAAWVTSQGGHYVLTVKGNQPKLQAALKRLPWKGMPTHSSADRQHGRRVRRTITVTDIPPWIDFPGAAQVAQQRRTRIIKGRKHVETVYLICSVPANDARPAQLAAWVCGHWAIENRLHWVRDVTFDEDRHQLRTGHAPQVMASLRNTAISLLRLAGHTSIATAQRHHARASSRPLNLIATA